MRDFSTIAALARKGITVYGLTVIPDMSSDMPYANGDRGYKINDNGCGRIMTFAQVKAAAQ